MSAARNSRLQAPTRRAALRSGSRNGESTLQMTTAEIAILLSTPTHHIHRHYIHLPTITHRYAATFWSRPSTAFGFAYMIPQITIAGVFFCILREQASVAISERTYMHGATLALEAICLYLPATYIHCLLSYVELMALALSVVNICQGSVV